MFASPVQLLLSPDAEATWERVMRPWIEARRGRLERAYVVVPTRGQALVWKQRCVRACLPLLGVEFVVPGLARRKWLSASGAERPQLGREFLLLGLRGLIEERLERGGGPAPAAARDDELAVWRSLRSDPERALQALDDLLQAGFAASDFPRPELAELGRELGRWATRLGYGFGQQQAIAAALEPLPPDCPPIAQEVLVVGLGVENTSEFFNVAALLRRAERATVVLPAPLLRGAAETGDTERPDEAWVTRWEKFLGVAADPLLIEEVEAGERMEPTPEILLGADRAAEAELIVGRVVSWLRTEGASEPESSGDVGVVFPGPGPLHRLVGARLRALGVPHHDHVGRSAAAPVDLLILRGAVAFWAKGGRLDELLALHPRLRAHNLAGLGAASGGFRRHVEERFQEACDHTLAAALGSEPAPAAGDAVPSAAASAGERGESRGSAAEDLRRLAAALLPGWPDKVALGPALTRLRQLAAEWGLTLPEGMEALDVFAAREPKVWPRDLVADTLLGFLPEAIDAQEPPAHRGFFAPVFLTTRRRAEHAPWSRLILTQANAGDWPRRRDPNPWLDDAARRTLNRGGRGAAPLLTSEEASLLERAGHVALMAAARQGAVLSAAARDEVDPDRQLAPNAVLERALWARGERRPREALERLALDPAGAPGTPAPEEWRMLRAGRFAADRPFDPFFLCIDDLDTIPLPARLSPSTLEKGAVDPAVLWFRGLLGLEPARREPLLRAPALRRGQVAHRLLAAAVRPEGARDGEWGPLRAPDEARERLERGLAAERALRPAGWYWEAEQGRLEALCRALLDRFHAAGEGDFVVVECWLPAEARLTVPGWTVPIRGRIDVARSDRPGWTGARVHLFDYKSGATERGINAARMAAKAESLQLALYLDAVRSLGTRAATIWKLTVEEATELEEAALEEALAGLPRIHQALVAGRYGALTPDRNVHGGPRPWEWPVACTPVPARDLRMKYALTRGAVAGASDEAGEEEIDD